MRESNLQKVRISLMLFAFLTGNHLMAAESWKEVKSESGITIYERWVKVTGESRAALRWAHS
jgi:hypothetical protein